MLQDVLTIGDKIEIKQLDHAGNMMRTVKTYVSQLVDFVDQDVIHIASPIGNSRVLILEVGENYNLCFYSNKGLYQCNCVVINNHRENNLVIAAVRITSNLEKLQRRQYYRLECVHEIEYRTITREEEILERKVRLDEFKDAEERTECRKKLNQLELNWLKASITDISGGGARFNSSESYMPGDKVRIRLDFILGKELRKLVLNAQIIASMKLMNRTGVYEHRVEFVGIGKNDREILIKYIFEQERRRRKNDKS